jgi:hypothetical protein
VKPCMIATEMETVIIYKDAEGESYAIEVN